MKVEQITDFIDNHESTYGEYYGDDVKTVAHTIITQVESGEYPIDFLTIDEFESWFDIDVVDDHEILDDFSDEALGNIRTLVSEFINENIIKLESLDIGLYDESEFQDEYDEGYEPEVLAEDLM